MTAGGEPAAHTDQGRQNRGGLHLTGLAQQGGLGKQGPIQGEGRIPRLPQDWSLGEPGTELGLDTEHRGMHDMTADHLLP